MALPGNASPINTSDTISDTIKTTTGYFTNGDGTIGGSDIHTSSLSATQEKYYYMVSQKHPLSASAEDQFSVTYGHFYGSGSDQYGDTSDNPSNIFGESQAIYKQFASMLLPITEITGGFFISATGTDGERAVASSTSVDEYIYVLVTKREKFKDRVNKKNWTLTLSGSDSTGSGVSLVLTDDSKDVAGVSTPAGLRYNIVSGSGGSVTSASSERTFGWFYPERGVFVFSGAELSSSIPGGPNFGKKLYSQFLSASNGGHIISHSGATFITDGVQVGDMIKVSSGSVAYGTDHYSQIMQVSGNLAETHFTSSTPWGGNTTTGSASAILNISTSAIIPQFSTAGNGTGSNVIASSSGFDPNLGSTGDKNNALRLINCMRNVSGTSLQLRSEEDATQENYFCRIGANDYNFSANPTWVSGSKNKIRHTTMHGSPQTFITSVGLYNSAGQLLAIAQLSKPIKKNFSSEATIKVKLTY